MAKPAPENLARYRWQVSSRVAAAALGGYALTSLAVAVLALALPRLGDTSLAEATLIATLWSFALYTGVAIWVFSTRSVRRAWAGLGLWITVLGAALLALKATA